ncbi:hypothetical protein [Aquimarina spongiae]|uniref:Uncharacterized protein n=1 Tax=Aquimarina spongiae TaxID=570521 RepID=A0A1M6I0G4_9FLAO|nr:hypothetical protein [Aquimarina spongiae]SHJ27905.1 hypothetical protein SAMN04488508_10731 [Aquimarina spongiae]
MKNNKLQITFKLLWLGITLFTIYMLGWLTFILFWLGNIFNEKYDFWNLLLPNILTIGILIIYTKEILFGYRPKSSNWNLKSLLVFSILIIILTIVQISQFEVLFDNPKSKSWQITLSLITILTAYVGILLNRTLRVK